MSTQQTLLDVDPSARHDDDFYRTPSWMVGALKRRLPFLAGLRVLEPAAGDGAIVHCLDPELDVITNDIVAREPLIPDFLLDARKRTSWQCFARERPIDVTIGNLPFDESFGILPFAVEFSQVGVAMLLRVTWIEPTEDRGPWLVEHPPTRVIVLPRWNFRSLDGKGGSDSASPAWFLWATEPGFCAPGIEVVTKDERDALLGEEKRRR